MQNDFIEREWAELCQRLETSAKHFAQDDQSLEAEFQQDVEKFSSQSAPNHYTDLLARVSGASKVAVAWQKQLAPSTEQSSAAKTAKQKQADRIAGEGDVEREDDLVEEVGLESFPASDPPSWNSSTL